MVGAVAGGAGPVVGPAVIVVSGVSGSGKSTVGALLADRLARPFLDADDLHSPANIAKMASGIALTDDDRGPWLDSVGRAALAQGHPGAVVACSALRVAHRDRLRGWVPELFVVQLTAPRELIGGRLAARVDHFMPASLLASQFAALEPLSAEEGGLVLEVAAAPADLVGLILQHLPNAVG
jgi:carbohydrate kinase (thermoresistant glucokinase family)